MPPIIVSIIYLDGAFEPFFDAFAVTLITGIVAWLPVKNYKNELRLRDGFLIVVLFWTVLASFGAIPFILSTQIDISITDAIFESLSGLTTTGATVIVGLDNLPESILYYRQQLQVMAQNERKYLNYIFFQPREYKLTRSEERRVGKECSEPW